jgi:hypothetical protein
MNYPSRFPALLDSLHAAIQRINPRLNDYLAESSPGRIEIIVMDYFEEPRELVSNVIKANVTMGVTGTPGR